MRTVKAIIGTAGHIDHGKTALVRLLTGMETDRLPAERLRGISIELGFAYLELPGGERAGIVDVPGHERFIRQMLAGAQGFDLVILTVAADDGVMPQTEEHFEIIHLLGVRKAVFVITKCDLVEGPRLAEVRSEIEILAAGTPYEKAAVIETSAQTGQGVEELRSWLVSMLKGLERPDLSGPFRMPIDRAFLIKGHGVVVTGTAAAGGVRLGDELDVVPGHRRVRVRDVQVHGEPVAGAYSGQRVALNLAGVERAEIGRGSAVVAPGLQADTRRFDARVEVRPSAARALKSHTRVRVYIGTSERMGRIVWLDGFDEVGPRTSAYAQVVLKESAMALPGDRFVLRNETASRTLGGGIVLCARAHPHHRAEGNVGERLRVLEAGRPAQRLAAVVAMSDGFGLPPDEASLAASVEPDALAELLGSCRDDVVALADPRAPALLVSRARYEQYLGDLVEHTQRFLEKTPNLAGIELESLRKALRQDLEPRLFRMIVDSLVAEGKLLRRGSRVAVAGHEVSMSEPDEIVAAQVLEVLRKGGTMPPIHKDLERQLGLGGRRLSKILAVLVERGQVVKISSEISIFPSVLEEVENRLRTYLEREGTITAAAFRDLISASRKYAIPLLDYFDRKGFTMRSGDVRRLRVS